VTAFLIIGIIVAGSVALVNVAIWIDPDDGYYLRAAGLTTLRLIFIVVVLSLALGVVA
jgi:hypothetical protein